MRHMKNQPVFRIFAFLLVVLIGMISLNPLGAMARERPSQGGGIRGEGDPLDSNDYVGDDGGGGGKDVDPHLNSAMPTNGGFMLLIGVLRDGTLVLPFFPGGVPVILIAPPATDPAAVDHAD